MDNITFVSPVHHEKYQALLARSQAYEAYDAREFKSALYVLAAELLIQGPPGVKLLFIYKGKIKDLSAAIREAQEKQS